MTNHTTERVSTVREFNRFYTEVLGVLHEGLLGTPYSLTEARLLFELAQRSATEVVELRRVLDLDPGYLSRVLARFETSGLVRRERSSEDGRRQVIRLTAAGRKAFRMLDRRSAEEIRTLLSPLADDDQRRLVGAMQTVRRLLEEPSTPRSFVLRPPGPGDYGWVVHRHGVLYAHEYGWDTSFEALVARIVADFVDHADASRESAWIGEVDGEPAGCVFCVKKDKRTAQLRLLLVEPRFRGAGVGGRLVEECIRFAERNRYADLILWTNDVLHDARRVYERSGFELVSEEPHHSFGHDLVGQIWRRELGR